MKNLKYSVPGQMLLMIKEHATTSIVFMILFLMTASIRNEFGDLLYGIFGVLGYFLSIYSLASTTYKNDNTKISPLAPKPLKGFILPAFLLLFNLLIVIVYKIAWAYGSNGQSMTQIWSLILNIISLLWVAPYQPILDMAHGYISLKGYLIIFVTPILASGLGYFAAYKGFDLNEKMHSIAYEKKKNTSKDKSEF